MRWAGSILQLSIRTFAACEPFPRLHFPRCDMPLMSPEKLLTGTVSKRAGVQRSEREPGLYIEATTEDKKIGLLKNGDPKDFPGSPRAGSPEQGTWV